MVIFQKHVYYLYSVFAKFYLFIMHFTHHNLVTNIWQIN